MGKNENKGKVLKDNKGLTYLELIIAITLLSVVLLAAQMFITFTYNSLFQVQGNFVITQEARIAFLDMENTIRSAQSKKIGAVTYKAVEVFDSGKQIHVYFDIDKDGDTELIQYKLDDKKLVKGVAEYGHTPTEYYTLINNVYNENLSTPIPVFTIDGSVVNIELHIVDDVGAYEDNPMELKASFTVRSKGAMW